MYTLSEGLVLLCLGVVPKVTVCEEQRLKLIWNSSDREDDYTAGFIPMLINYSN